jgi:hypothetical protein
VTFNDGTKKGTIRIYDLAAAQILGTDLDNTFTNNMYCGTSNFNVARRSENSGRDFWGDIDEAVVFNDVLSAAEIDQIRSGTFGGEAPPAASGGAGWPVLLHHWYRRR